MKILDLDLNVLKLGILKKRGLQTTGMEKLASALMALFILSGGCAAKSTPIAQEAPATQPATPIAVAIASPVVFTFVPKDKSCGSLTSLLGDRKGLTQILALQKGDTPETVQAVIKEPPTTPLPSSMPPYANRSVIIWSGVADDKQYEVRVDSGITSFGHAA